MTVFPILAVSFIMKVVAAIWFLCAIALILIILVQKGKGGGLGGAFGGGMASGILGSKTGDFLTWFTIILVGVFLVFAVIMAKFYKPTVSDFGQDQVQRQPMQQEQPTRPAPAPLIPTAPSESNNNG